MGGVAGEPQKGLAVSGCSPERSVNMQHSGVATNSRSRGPAWASQCERCHLLGSLSNGLTLLEFRFSGISSRGAGGDLVQKCVRAGDACTRKAGENYGDGP